MRRLLVRRPAPSAAVAAPPARARRRAMAAAAMAAAAMAAAAPRARPRGTVAPAARRPRAEIGAAPLEDDDDLSDDSEDDELFLAALADLDAEEEELEDETEEAVGRGRQENDADPADAEADSNPEAPSSSSSSGDPYLLPGFGIEEKDDSGDSDDNDEPHDNQPKQQRRKTKRGGGRRQQRPSSAPTLAALSAAVLASDGGGESALSPRELVRSLGAWARLCTAERKSGGGGELELGQKDTSALRVLLLAAGERASRLSPAQAAGALKGAAQCCAALAAAGQGTGRDSSGAASLLPWPAIAALFGRLLLSPTPPAAAAASPPPPLLLLHPDLPPRAACEALWAAGALHARLSQDAAARRAAERHAALAPLPRPPPARRGAAEDEEALLKPRKRGATKRRGPAPDPPAPRPGEDARSELARLFLREDGVAGTLPPQPQGSPSSPAPLVRSEAQDHALAVAASAAEAATAAAQVAAEAAAESSSSRPRSLSLSLPGLPPDVLALACRLCDAFVAACDGYDDDDQDEEEQKAPPLPLPELAAAAAASARLQRPPAPLLRLIERRLCADGGRELRAAATRDLVTIAWAAGTAAEDAVAAGGGRAADQAASIAQSVAPRKLMACLASECRRRLEREAEARVRFAALAEAAIAEREQRARGVGVVSGASAPSSSSPTPKLWPNDEAAGQMHDAELPVSRTRKQAEWLEELDELLRRSGGAGAIGSAATGPPLSSSSSHSSSPRLALLATEGERHLRPGGLMDRLAAADAARWQAAAAAAVASDLPPDQRIGPAEAASLLVATARAAYVDDSFIDACLRAHGDAWASAAGTGAGTWPLRAGARPPRSSPRQRGALARVAWALALLGRCPAHDEDALLRHAVDALAGSEAGVMSALPGDVLDLTRALAAGRVRLPAPLLRRWTARGIARAVTEGAGLGVLAAKRKLTDPYTVLPTPADALLPDQVASLALAAARLPRGAGAAAWSPPTALAALSPWLPIISPLCSPSALADLAEAYALDGRPADDGGMGLAAVVEAAAASIEAFDAPTLMRLLRSVLQRAGEARRQRRIVRRRLNRLARGEGLDHDVDEEAVLRAMEEEEDEDADDDARAAAVIAERQLSAALGPLSGPAARDHALESLPWRLRQRLRGSAAAPGRVLLRAQGALPAPAGRPGLGDAPYVPADASDAGIEARWRAYGGGLDLKGLEKAASPDLSPLLRAVDERLRPSRPEEEARSSSLGPELALGLLAAMASDAAAAAESQASASSPPPPHYDRDRLAAWLAREVVGGQGAQRQQRASRSAAEALRLAWAAGARLPAAGVAAPLARAAASWPGLPPDEAVDVAWALLRMGCCLGGGGGEEEEAASQAAASTSKLLRGAARRLERVEAEASSSASSRSAASLLGVPSSLPVRLIYCWRELARGEAAPLPPSPPRSALAIALRCLPTAPPDALCWLIVGLSGFSAPEEAELLRLAARELGKRKGVEERVGGPLLAEARRAVAASGGGGGGGGGA